MRDGRVVLILLLFPMQQTLPMENVHSNSPQQAPTPPVPSSVVSPPPPAAVTLSAIDLLGIFAAQDSSAILEHTRSLAQALAGIDGAGVRTRLISKLAAAERGNLAFAQKMLAEALRKGEASRVDLAEKVVRGIHARLLGLLREHRLNCDRERRPQVMVAVGHADSVRVGAGR